MLSQKYQTKSFEDIVGRDDLIAKIKKFLSKPDGIPQMIFWGSPGTGKTTMAEVIANTVFGEHVTDMFYCFNASSDRGIDIIRDKVLEIAKKRPLFGNYKIILMDEADMMTFDAQNALRQIMIKFFPITRFIFTCNYPSKISEAIYSRCFEVEFTPIEAKTLALYLKKIASKEGINKTDGEYIRIAKDSNGDIRKALQYLEDTVSRKSVFEGMTMEALKKMSPTERFKAICSEEANIVFTRIFEIVRNEERWEQISILAECQYRMSHSVHKQLFLMDMLHKMFRGA